MKANIVSKFFPSLIFLTGAILTDQVYGSTTQDFDKLGRNTKKHVPNSSGKKLENLEPKIQVSLSSTDKNNIDLPALNRGNTDSEVKSVAGPTFATVMSWSYVPGSEVIQYNMINGRIVGYSYVPPCVSCKSSKKALSSQELNALDTKRSTRRAKIRETDSMTSLG